MKSEISFANIPVAHVIAQSIERLMYSLFESEYAEMRIKTKIPDIVRALIRDNITEKKGLNKVLFEMFHQTHAASHIHGVQEKFRQLGKYQDVLSEAEVYSEVIFQEIKQSSDQDFIADKIGKLTGVIKRLKTLYADTMKNPLYIQSKKVS